MPAIKTAKSLYFFQGDNLERTRNKRKRFQSEERKSWSKIRNNFTDANQWPRLIPLGYSIRCTNRAETLKTTDEPRQFLKTNAIAMNWNQKRIITDEENNNWKTLFSKYFIWERDKNLLTKASRTGTGKQCDQKTYVRKLRPIAFARRYLVSAKNNYWTGETDIPEIVWGLLKFRLHFCGKTGSTKKDLQKQWISRWLDKTFNVDISMQDTNGSILNIAKLFSIHPGEKPSTESVCEKDFVKNTFFWIFSTWLQRRIKAWCKTKVSVDRAITWYHINTDPKTDQWNCFNDEIETKFSKENQHEQLI